MLIPLEAVDHLGQVVVHKADRPGHHLGVPYAIHMPSVAMVFKRKTDWSMRDVGNDIVNCVGYWYSRCIADYFTRGKQLIAWRSGGLMAYQNTREKNMLSNKCVLFCFVFPSARGRFHEVPEAHLPSGRCICEFWRRP